MMQVLNGAPGKRAVAYYRHSAEDKQENSVPIQREHARKFAKEHGIEIIHEEADEGKTGLLANRPGFMTLFDQWIENAEAPPFEYILVYDVSRWGRFQNQNEPAHYEFRCTMRNKKVIYIEDGFPKEDQQLIGSLQIAVKRYMAAEYSRQLSGKVFHGCVKVSEQGYSAGGMPCYGMARELLDECKQPIRLLKKGEHKEISNQRVRFVPLYDETTQAVRDIFSMFVQGNASLSSIISVFNDRGIPSATGGVWDKDKIIRILMNETYTGARIYNKTWNRLRQGKRNNPREEWVVYRDAFSPIVSREMFDTAQEKLWFILRKWKEGRQAMKRAKAVFMDDMERYFLHRGFSEDEVFFLRQDFPLLSGVSRQMESGWEWCFLLPDHMRFQPIIVCMAVFPKNAQLIDRFFRIPVDDFGRTGLCHFSNTDDCCMRYFLPTDNLENTILETAAHMRERL